MRREKDHLGSVEIEDGALYGIHSCRASENFPDSGKFREEWYRAIGVVKLACYQTYGKFRKKVLKEYPELADELFLISEEVLSAMMFTARQVMEGKYFEHFIVPALQGGAGTSINMNVNEIITNAALISLEKKAGEYGVIDPIESANIYQSTNDVIPTALTVASMRLLKELEAAVNTTRSGIEQLEQKYRSTLRLGYTQMQEAVPSTYGILFSTYNDSLSRDWWRISKAAERIKQVNLGGGATGTGISIPRFFIMEVTAALKNLTGLPIAQGENLSDITANLDSYVEVHAILKAHAVNLKKMVNDMRLLSSGIVGDGEMSIAEMQAGSSIMPGKVNPVICEYVISSAHQLFSNDQLITELASEGCLELNAYIPSIGNALLESLQILIQMNQSISKHLLPGIRINEAVAREKLFKSPAITTALSPLIGYHRASLLAIQMKETGKSIFDVNEELKIMTRKKLEEVMKPEKLIKKGFTMSDLKDFGTK